MDDMLDPSDLAILLNLPWQCYVMSFVSLFMIYIAYKTYQEKTNLGVRVFVGNLSFKTTEVELEHVFKLYGKM
jgi:hypothetical protein